MSATAVANASYTNNLDQHSTQNNGSLDDREADDMEDPPSFFVRALYDFESNDASSLSFRKGALIEVLTQLESGWWDGLLDNHVRGWFPSNYVEAISDQEAEMELTSRAQMQAHYALDMNAHTPIVESDTFSRLGFGAGFDGLQALIKGDGIGNSDAFSQLAEAAMLDPSRRALEYTTQLAQLSLNSNEPQQLSHRNHHGSDPASIASNNASSSTSSIDGQSRTGQPPNLALASTSSSAMDKDRLRAASLSNASSDRYPSPASAAAAALGRPRAATGSLANDADYWIPKSTERGQIVYHNTRTGAVSTDIPQDSSHQSGSGRSRHDSSPSRQGLARITEPTSRGTSASRPSSAQSSGTAVLANSASLLRPPTQNSVDQMPDPNSVPKPWRLRLTDDEKYFFYLHRHSNEIRWNYADARSKLTLLSNVGTNRPNHDPSSSSSSLSEAADHSDTKKKSHLGKEFDAVPNASSLNFDSDESDVDGDLNPRLPGKSPKIRHIALGRRKASSSRSIDALADHPVLGPPKVAPPTLTQEEKAAYDLQKGLLPTQIKPISILVRRAHEAIRQLAAIATEQIGTDGLSAADKPSWNTSGDNYMPRLVAATAFVVAAIREVLYATGSLALSPTDLIAVSKLVAPLQQGSFGHDQLAYLTKLLQALHGSKTLDASILQDAGINPRDSLSTTPNPLHPIGRKLNAVISKLVLSSRQVIDHTVTLASSPTSGMESTMTDLDADVFSKLYQCRQRLREDALELMRTLQTFSSEAEKARSTALGTQHSRGWLRRADASIESDLGLNGVGPTSFGSGMAAGWLGNGFVLPSKYEVATIKAETQGTRMNPFEQSRDADAAILRGAATLRRLPRQMLNQQTMIALHDRLAKISTVADGIADDASGTADRVRLVSTVADVLRRYGSLNNLVEDVDLASSLDVDGPSPNQAQVSAINERNAVNAKRARDLMRRFVILKQACYDASCILLLQLQSSLSDVERIGNRKEGATAPVAPCIRNLVRISSVMIKTLDQLATVAEEQLKDASPFLGARAFVYGTEDGISTPTTGIFTRKASIRSNGLHDEVEAMARYGSSQGEEPTSDDTDLMYLGPGIVVPNGPRSRSGSRTSPATNPSISGSTLNSPAASLAPSGRGMGLASDSYRQRSTSVTTGGSGRSMQSYGDSQGRLMSRRGTLNGGEGADEDGDSRTSGSKVRRLLGDDAPLSSALTHDSEAASSSISTRRREEEVPWFLEPDYMGDDIVIAQDGSVKGATLEALLARLTMHNSYDASFNNTFLMTYRSFTDTQTLLDLLAQRFRILPPEGLSEEELTLWAEKKQIPIRLRVFNVLKSWLETHFYEGEDDKYLEQVKKFAVEEMGEAASMKGPSQHLLRLVERRQGEGEQMIRKMVLPTSAPPPILPKNLKKLKFLEIDPLELARQLTLIESRLYNKVKPAECLGLKWTRPDNDIHAKGIMESINTHNRISSWVAESILQQEDLKKRAALIKHFISIADRCRALNNFSGMWAIVSALSTAPIHRLRRTWDAVNQKNVLVFESLETLMSASRNWANYRETIHKLNPPCVPFLGRYLGDLTFIEDGNRDRLKENDKLINFGKRQKTAEVIREITIHQSTPYNLQVVAPLERFIEDNLAQHNAKTADELYEQSLMLEPREREDEKIARLLQESGFL